MDIKRIELSAGVWLNMIQTDRFKTGCVSVNFLRPLDEKTAAIHALLPSVLLRGCRSYPDMQSISHRLDELYGSTIGTLIRKRGEMHAFGLYADFLEDRYAEQEPVFEQMMAFLQELIFMPCLEEGGFIEDYVSGEKQNLSNAIDARINDKRSYAITRLLKHMCAGEAYCVTRLGEKEALKNVDGKSLYRFWQDVLATSPVELFYLGQQPEEKVLEQMRKFVSFLPKRNELCNVSTQLVLPEREVKFVEEEMDVTQGKLTIGFRTSITANDPRMAALMVLNAVYGSGMTSKLFMKIREEQSLCYYASSSVDKHKGILVVSSGIEADKFEVAKDGILHQLELCKQGDISEEELFAAKKYLVSALRASNDSPGQLDDFSIGQAVSGSSGSIEDQINEILAVTVEGVIEAASTIVLDTVYFLKGVNKC